MRVKCPMRPDTILGAYIASQLDKIFQTTTAARRKKQNMSAKLYFQTRTQIQDQ